MLVFLSTIQKLINNYKGPHTSPFSWKQPVCLGSIVLLYDPAYPYNGLLDRSPNWTSRILSCENVELRLRDSWVNNTLPRGQSEGRQDEQRKKRGREGILRKFRFLED